MTGALASTMLVRLVVDEADPAGLPSRVDDVTDREVLVAAPTFGGDLFVAPGRPVTVVWADARGMYELATVLTEVLHERVQVWRLTRQGEPQLLQRRRFVRVRCNERVVVRVREPWWLAGGADEQSPGGVAPVAGTPGSAGAVELSTAAADGLKGPGAADPDLGATDDAELPTELNGLAMDLSEGGVRVRLETAATRALRNGSSVTVEMSLGGSVVLPAGTVLRVTPVERGQAEVVIRFDEPVQGEADIRRWVMQQQLLERRAARDA